MLLALSRLHQARENVLTRQLIKVFDDFLKHHPECEPAQHFAHRDACIAHARLAKAFIRIDRDSVGEGRQMRVVNLWRV